MVTSAVPHELHSPGNSSATHHHQSLEEEPEGQRGASSLGSRSWSMAKARFSPDSSHVHFLLPSRSSQHAQAESVSSYGSPEKAGVQGGLPGVTRTQQWRQEASFDPILLLSQMTFDFWKEVLGSLPYHWWASKVGFPTGSRVCAQKGLSLVHGLLSASGNSSLFLKTGLHFHSVLGPTNSAAHPIQLCQGSCKGRVSPQVEHSRSWMVRPPSLP